MKRGEAPDYTILLLSFLLLSLGLLVAGCTQTTDYEAENITQPDDTGDYNDGDVDSGGDGLSEDDDGQVPADDADMTDDEDEEQDQEEEAESDEQDEEETEEATGPCELCVENVVFFEGDGLLCSDEECSCSSEMDYTCTIDDHLQIGMTISNLGEEQLSFIIPEIFCTNADEYLRWYGGLWIMTDHEGVAFPGTRTYLSRVLPGGYVDFRYEFKLADFDEGKNVVECEFTATKKTDGVTENFINESLSLMVTK